MMGQRQVCNLLEDVSDPYLDVCLHFTIRTEEVRMYQCANVISSAFRGHSQTKVSVASVLSLMGIPWENRGTDLRVHLHASILSCYLLSSTHEWKKVLVNGRG